MDGNELNLYNVSNRVLTTLILRSKRVKADQGLKDDAVSYPTVCGLSTTADQIEQSPNLRVILAQGWSNAV